MNKAAARLSQHKGASEEGKQEGGKDKIIYNTEVEI